MMVKPTRTHSSASTTEYVSDISSSSSSSNSRSSKYKGVRKRKWGKWVSEIRLPNSRERIWLGSYDSAEKAARAFDAALYCLRGCDAKFNFPANPPEIVGGRSLRPPEIQVVAARFAEEVETVGPSSTPGNDNQVESYHREEMMDWSFLSMLDITTEQGMSDYSFYLPSDQLYPPPQILAPPPNDDNVDDENGGDAFSQSSFLWNF